MEITIPQGAAVKYLNLSVVDNDAPIEIMTAQAGDAGSRYAVIKLYDDRGELDITSYSDGVIILESTKPDGTIYTSSALQTDDFLSIQDNSVVMRIPDEILTRRGRVKNNIKLTKGGVTLTTSMFYIHVLASQADNDGIKNNTDTNLFYEANKAISALTRQPIDTYANEYGNAKVLLRYDDDQLPVFEFRHIKGAPALVLLEEIVFNGESSFAIDNSSNNIDLKWFNRDPFVGERFTMHAVDSADGNQVYLCICEILSLGSWYKEETNEYVPNANYKIVGRYSLRGATGATGATGTPGTNGTNGVSCTHFWNGTVLTITSASGTSSSDLVGEKGDKGDPGITLSYDESTFELTIS